MLERLLLRADVQHKCQGRKETGEHRCSWGRETPKQWVGLEAVGYWLSSAPYLVLLRVAAISATAPAEPIAVWM